MTSDWRAIPGQAPTPPNGNLADIAEAGGLHTFQLDLHERYGPVARFELPGTRVVSVSDPELLAVTSRINRRPQELFEFLSPCSRPATCRPSRNGNTRRGAGCCCPRWATTGRTKHITGRSPG